MIARLLAGAAVWVNRSNRDIQSEKLTETIEAMANPAPAAGAIRRLYGLSVKVGIDAFGNGYSALAAIDRRAVREFKIDQSWWSTECCRLHRVRGCRRLRSLPCNHG